MDKYISLHKEKTNNQTYNRKKKTKEKHSTQTMELLERLPPTVVPEDGHWYWLGNIWFWW